MDDIDAVPETASSNDGWEWMLVEIMGHRSHWGRTREEERFGTKMLRIDVPIKGDPAVHGWSTHFYGGTAIFSITLTDESTVMLKNMPWDAPARLQYARPPSPIDDQAIDTSPVPEAPNLIDLVGTNHPEQIDDPNLPDDDMPF